MTQTTILYVYTDGGSRGNPGEAALGFYVENQSQQMLAGIGRRLGVATNNVAEYNAILEALSWIVSNKSDLPNLKEVNFFMDSQLASSQLNGVYKVKNSKLREIIFEIRQKEAEINLAISYSHVPREQNKKADKLVNQALDEKLT